MRKFILVLILYPLCILFPSYASSLGQLPTIKSNKNIVKEFIELKVSLSERISQCFSTPDQLPPNDLTELYGSEGPPFRASSLDQVGEKLLLSFLDYVCIIDQNKVLLVMGDWIGINKLDI